MTIADRKTAETTRPDPSTAPTGSERKNYLGLAAGAVAIAGVGIGLTALFIGVTGNMDTEAPSPNVPPSVELPYDANDPEEMRGIDNRLYQLAEQPFDANDPEEIRGIDNRLYQLAEQPSDANDPEEIRGIDNRLYQLVEQLQKGARSAH
jgi:hypothetical protein